MNREDVRAASTRRIERGKPTVRGKCFVIALANLGEIDFGLFDTRRVDPVQGPLPVPPGPTVIHRMNEVKDPTALRIPLLTMNVLGKKGLRDDNLAGPDIPDL